MKVCSTSRLKTWGKLSKFNMTDFRVTGFSCIYLLWREKHVRKIYCHWRKRSVLRIMAHFYPSLVSYQNRLLRRLAPQHRGLSAWALRMALIPRPPCLCWADPSSLTFLSFSQVMSPWALGSWNKSWKKPTQLCNQCAEAPVHSKGPNPPISSPAEAGTTGLRSIG